MNIRLGFVSNSSSSSFTVYGACISDEDGFEELTGMTVYDYANKHKLRKVYGDPNAWDRYVYLGLVLSGEFEHAIVSDLGEDETKAQFMKRVDGLLPGGIPEEDIGMFSESFRDG